MHVARRSHAELRNTVSVVPLLTVPAIWRQHNWDISATDTTLSILPVVGVSIVYAERFQRRYRRQPTFLVRPERGTTKTIQLHTDIHSTTVPRNNGDILQRSRQAVPALDVVLLLHWWYPCLCAEIMSTKSIRGQDKHDTLNKHEQWVALRSQCQYSLFSCCIPERMHLSLNSFDQQHSKTGSTAKWKQLL